MSERTAPVPGGDAERIPAGQAEATPPSRLSRLLNSPFLAYTALVLLQLRVVWGFWDVKDVTSGDTACYFTTALEWVRHGQVEIVWSPVYTAFLGGVLTLTADPAAAIHAHRLIIVLAASLLVLALFRQLLPAPLAWLTAAWWAVLPTSFDTLYEVHLFAVVPVLITWLLLSYPNRWARGAALAVTAAAAALVRNELCIVAGVLGVTLVWWEWRTARPAEISPLLDRLRRLAAYGIPLAFGACLCAAAYSRSIHKYPEVMEQAKAKNVYVTGQWFAMGYYQRHPEWRAHNPWVDFPALMRAKFGKDEATMSEMIAANPRAVLGHWAWNWRLAPAGLQGLLFYTAVPGPWPDSMGGKQHTNTAVLLTGLVLGLWAAAATVAWRRGEWSAGWRSDRGLVWFGMLGSLPGVLLIITNVHPRPAYLFSFGVSLMALTALSIFVLTRPFWGWGWVRTWGQAVAAVVVLLVARPHYRADATVPRPVATVLQRLSPYQSVLQSPGAVVQAGDRAFEVSTYAGLGLCRAVDNPTLLATWPAGEPLRRVLDRTGVTVLYIDESTWDLFGRTRFNEAAEFLRDRPVTGWDRLADCQRPGERWRLYVRSGSAR